MGVADGGGGPQQYIFVKIDRKIKHILLNSIHGLFIQYSITFL